MDQTLESFEEALESLTNYFIEKGYQVLRKRWDRTITQGKNEVLVKLKFVSAGDPQKTADNKYRVTMQLSMIFAALPDTELAFCERIKNDYQYFFEHLIDGGRSPSGSVQ